MLVSDREFLVMKGIAPVRYMVRTIPTLPYSHRAHKGLGVMGYYDLLAQANLQNCDPTDITCVANNTAKQAAVEDYWAAHQSTGVPDGTVISIPTLTPAQVTGPTGFYDPSYQAGNVVAALPVTVTSPNTTPQIVVQGVVQPSAAAAAAATAAAQQVAIAAQGYARNPATGQITSVATGQPVTPPSNITTGYYYTTPPPTTQTQTPAPTQSYPVSMAFITTSGTSQMHVGDTWTVHVTGRPGDPVTVTGSKDGVAFTAVNEGVIDATGNFILSGTVHDADVGSWDETWHAGSSAAGEVVFTVAPAGYAQTPGVTPTANPIASLVHPGTTPYSTTVLATTPTGTDVLPTASGTFLGDLGIGASALLNPSEWSSVMTQGTLGEKVGLLGIPVAVVVIYMMHKKGRR